MSGKDAGEVYPNHTEEEVYHLVVPLSCATIANNLDTLPENVSTEMDHAGLVGNPVILQ